MMTCPRLVGNFSLVDTAQACDSLHFEPIGGVQVRNKRGQVILWFKGKDPESGSSYGLCMYRPKLADPEMRKMLPTAFETCKAIARMIGLPLYNIDEVDREVAKMLKELGPNHKLARSEDVTVPVTDLVSGRPHKLTIALHPPEKIASTER
jgi:hypothetical protein